MQLPLWHVLGAFLFLGWYFPFWGLPLTSFYQEWLTSWGILVVAGVVWVCRPDRAGTSDVLAALGWLLAAGLVLALWHWARGAQPSVWVQLPYVAAAVLAAVAYWLGGQLAPQLAQGQRAAEILFAWVLAAASYSALAVVLQVSNLGDYVYPLVRSLDLRVYRPSANLGQPNMLCLQLFWGLAALLWLWVNGRLSGLQTAGLALLISLAIALTGSRTALLLMPVCALCAVRLAAPYRWRVWLWCLGLMPLLYLVVRYTYQDFMRWMGIDLGASPRVIFQDNVRLDIWRVTLGMLAQHPWIGAGPGAFSMAFFDYPDSARAISGALSHSHNLPLQLMAELGVPIGLVISLALLYGWVKLFWTTTTDVLSPVCLAISATALVHSLLEFPLWWLSFLLPFALFQGVAVALVRQSIPSERLAAAQPEQPVAALWGRRSMPELVARLALCAGALVLALWVLVDFQRLVRDYEEGITIGSRERIETIAQRPLGASMFWIFDAYARVLVTPETPANLPELLDLARVSVKRFPFPKGLLRYASLAAQMGSTQDMDAALKALHTMYPASFTALRAQQELLCNATPAAAYQCRLKARLLLLVPQSGPG